MPKKILTINDLGDIIKKEVTSVKKEINSLENKIDTKIDTVKKEIDEFGIIVKNEFSKVNKNIKELKQGQENIELKLTNVAYRFELLELERRIEILEKKLK